jgi:hypothetical protein
MKSQPPVSSGMAGDLVGPEHPDYEIGLRIALTVISYNIGNRTADAMIRARRGERIPRHWVVTGRALADQARQAVWAALGVSS